MTDPRLNQLLADLDVHDRSGVDRNKPPGSADFKIYEDSPEDVVEDQDKHEPELQLCRQKLRTGSGSLMHGASMTLVVDKDEQDCTSAVAPTMSSNNKETFEDHAQDDKPIERRDESKEPSSHGQSLSNMINADPHIKNLAITLIRRPLVLTASEHVPHVATVIDSRTPAAELSTNVQQAAQASPIEVNTEQQRPVFRRLGSHRPPPSTPPEASTHGKLSMPTLPSLHPTSIPGLIEDYRRERRQDPAAFDKKTMAIKQDSIQAKIERGGEATLLNHEYTAELASRLDAEAIEQWSVVRQHGEEQPYVESDPDDEESVYKMTEEKLATATADDAGAIDQTAHNNEEKPEAVTVAAAATDAGATDQTQDDEGKEPEAAATVAKPAMTTYDEYFANDRAAIAKARGTITYDTHVIHRTLPDGSKKRVYQTIMKLTSIVEVPKDEHHAGENSNTENKE